MDQQKQPTTADTKTGVGVQPAQSQQQKGNIPQDQGNKEANPSSGNQAPLKEETASASTNQKAL